MSFKNGVLEGSRLDFGGPKARFWRVLAPFFRDFGPLGKRNAGTDFELKAKAAQFQLGAQVGHSSYFYVEVRPRSSHREGGRAVSPFGGLQSAAHRRWCEACWIIIRFVELKALNLSLSMPSLNSPSPNAQHPSLILSPAAQGPPQPRPKKASTVGFG